MADDITPDNTAPGDSFVTRAGIIAIAAYLLLLMLLLFFLIGWLWPTCEETTCKDGTTQNQNRAANSNNSNGAAPGPAANGNSNANTNANTNTNINANTGTDTTTNTSETAPPGPTRSPATPAPVPTRTPTTPAPGAGQTTGIDVDTITPTSGSVCGGTQVTIKGKNFPKEPVVEFGGALALVGTHSSENISASSPAHPAGTVDVVVKGDGDQMDRIPLAFSYTCPSPSGASLFWLVLLAGALGGTIHALRSLYWYVGNRTLKRSWVLMYVFLPFSGAAIALIFYMIIVAGLLPSSTGKDVPLYVIAVGALAGMFSTQAALKLTDLANAVFTQPEQGKDAKPQRGVPPSGGGAPTPPAGGSASIEPPNGKASEEKPVEIKGTGFTDVLSVTFGGKASVTPPTFDAPTSAIRATAPKREEGPGDVDVVVTNKTGKTVTLKYKYIA